MRNLPTKNELSFAVKGEHLISNMLARIRRWTPFSVALLSLAFIAIVFQNCGGFKAVDQTSSGLGSATNSTSIISTSNPNPTPSSSSFKAGQPFNKDLFPYPMDDDNSENIDFCMRSTGAMRTLAVNRRGSTYCVYGYANYESQAEADRVALEGCEITSQGEPCTILMSQGRFRFDKTDLENHYSSVMQRGSRPLDARRIPLVIKSLQDQIANGYKSIQAAYKYSALAFSPNGHYRHFGSNTSQADANRLVLQVCEASSGGLPCMLLAIGNTLVLDPKILPAKIPSALDFSQANFNPDLVPMIPIEASAELKAYVSLAQSGEVAMAISDIGYYSIATGQTRAEASAQALAICSKDLIEPSRCFLYAEKNKIVWKKSDLIIPE